MSKLTQQVQAALSNSWLVPVLVTGVVAAAVISYARTTEIQAAPGSPYYGKAVQEAMAGLVSPGTTPAPAGAEPGAGAGAEAIPPLPAGLSPNDYYWCPQHKTYHPRQAGQASPAGAAQVPAAGAQPAGGAAPPAAAGTTPPAPAAVEIPPLIAGKSPNDYEWCENCKGYHKRAVPGQPVVPPAPTPVGANPSAPVAPAGQPAEAIPPLPPEFSPNDYYWCPKCKAYHPKQGNTPEHPADEAGTPAAPTVPAPLTPLPAPLPAVGPTAPTAPPAPAPGPAVAPATP